MYDFTIDNKENAYALQLLYQYLGAYGYFYHFLQKCKIEENFIYTKEEKEWIEKQKYKNQKKIENLFSNLVRIEKESIRYAICIANYAYRNVLADYIKEHAKNIDVLLLLAGDENCFSFRSINPQINVNDIAKTCGGGGHTKAAGGELNKETLQKILKFLK